MTEDFVKNDDSIDKPSGIGELNGEIGITKFRCPNEACDGCVYMKDVQINCEWQMGCECGFVPTHPSD
jgi:hypothetical protein